MKKKRFLISAYQLHPHPCRPSRKTVAAKSNRHSRCPAPRCGTHCRHRHGPHARGSDGSRPARHCLRVTFRVLPDHLRILAVKHHRRQPDYWRARMENRTDRRHTPRGSTRLRIAPRHNWHRGRALFFCEGRKGMEDDTRARRHLPAIVRVPALLSAPMMGRSDTPRFTTRRGRKCRIPVSDAGLPRRPP